MPPEEFILGTNCPLEVTECLKELQQIGSNLKKRQDRYNEIYPRVEEATNFRKVTPAQAQELSTLEREIEGFLFWQQALIGEFEKHSYPAVKYYGLPFEQLLRAAMSGNLWVEKDTPQAKTSAAETGNAQAESETEPASAIAARRKSKIEPLLKEREWNTNLWATAAHVSWHVADDYLKGKKTRLTNREALAKALGISPEKLP